MAELDLTESSEFELTLKLNTEAFTESSDAAFQEIARILQHAAAKIATGSVEFSLYDKNGLMVGSCGITDT